MKNKVQYCVETKNGLLLCQIIFFNIKYRENKDIPMYIFQYWLGNVNAGVFFLFIFNIVLLYCVLVNLCNGTSQELITNGNKPG